jgi:ankyrin repeat protein
LTGVRNALNQGAKPNFFFNPEDSKNSLHVAAEGGYIDILQELLQHGAMIETIVKGSKETALLLATRELQVETVKFLLENDANILAGMILTLSIFLLLTPFPPLRAAPADSQRLWKHCPTRSNS